MFRLFSSILPLLAAYSAAAQDLPDHNIFDRALQRVVYGRSVDYAALKAGPGDLGRYLEELASVATGRLEEAEEAVQLAFWINAYNACALQLVIDHYPIKRAGFPASLVRSLQGVPANSIRQIPDTWTRAFCPVAGAPRALDEIEHEILRPMGEPRIHFAVNCASRSCPVLAPTAYTAEVLGEQLDAAVRRFVENPAHVRLQLNGRVVLRLNRVLDWYKEDFGGVDGVIDFLIPYLPADDALHVRAHGRPSVEYAPYDWTLNDTAVFGAGR